jgi:biotin transport system permease protein
MLTLTSPVDTPLHRWPAGPKLAGLCAGTVLLFALTGPEALAAAAAAVALFYLACGRVFAGAGLRLLRPLWPFVLLLAVWHLWSGDLRGGAEVILRMGTAVALANLVTLTTRLSDMLTLLERGLAPLERLGLSAQMLALSVALVIRFVPVMLERAGQITLAWRARSARRPGWRIVVPVALAALDDAEHVAEALRARGGTG